MIWLAITAWALIGMAGFTYWWTTDYDLTTAQIPLLAFGALLGLFAWPIGWTIHGRQTEFPRTIVKRRRPWNG